MNTKEIIATMARAAWAERVRFSREENGIDLEAYEERVFGLPGEGPTVAERNKPRSSILTR